MGLLPSALFRSPAAALPSPFPSPTVAMASSDLQWQVLRKYSRYLTRNAVGDRRYFSTEATNVRKIHSRKYNGVVVLVRRSNGKGPKTDLEKIHMKKGARAIHKSISNMTKKINYRGDLTASAQAAASQILRSQQRKTEE